MPANKTTQVCSITPSTFPISGVSKGSKQFRLSGDSRNGRKLCDVCGTAQDGVGSGPPDFAITITGLRACALLMLGPLWATRAAGPAVAGGSLAGVGNAKLIDCSCVDGGHRDDVAQVAEAAEEFRLD